MRRAPPLGAQWILSWLEYRERRADPPCASRPPTSARSSSREEGPMERTMDMSHTFVALCLRHHLALPRRRCILIAAGLTGGLTVVPRRPVSCIIPCHGVVAKAFRDITDHSPLA